MKTLIKTAIVILLCFTANTVFAAECSEANNQIGANKKNPKELRKLLDKYPGCGEIWEALGDYYYDKEVWDEAYTNYEEAQKCLPEKSKLTNRLKELRPRLTGLLRNEQDVLEFRRQIGGKTHLAAGARPGSDEPSSVAKAPPDTTSGPAVAGARTAKGKTSKVAATPHPKEQPLPKGEKVGLMINFESRSAEISPEGKKLLDNFADVLKNELSGKKFCILGHTDNIGSRALNLDLSERRAESVKAYLSQCGIDGSRLTVRGLGFDKPIYDNDTESGRGKNRRVEFESM